MSFHFKDYQITVQCQPKKLYFKTEPDYFFPSFAQKKVNNCPCLYNYTLVNTTIVLTTLSSAKFISSHMMPTRFTSSQCLAQSAERIQCNDILSSS